VPSSLWATARGGVRSDPARPLRRSDSPIREDTPDASRAMSLTGTRCRAYGRRQL